MNNKHDFVKIGARIQSERKLLGISSLEGMREKIEEYGCVISRQALGAIEKGEDTKAFTANLIDILCELFNCDAGYLLCEYNDCKTRDNQFIHDQTGLSENAIDILKQKKVFNDHLSEDPDITTVNLLLEQLYNNIDDNIIHSVASYFRSNGLSQDMYYDVKNGTISSRKPIMEPDNITISGHTDMFDNLILMDIQTRLIALKQLSAKKQLRPHLTADQKRNKIAAVLARTRDFRTLDFDALSEDEKKEYIDFNRPEVKQFQQQASDRKRSLTPQAYEEWIDTQYKKYVP